ncbi:hypothetical protein Tco_0243017 [Tanacetum coccineum]
MREEYLDTVLENRIGRNQFEDFSESNDDFTLIDKDSFSIDDIDYVEASPPDSELASLEVVEIVILKVEDLILINLQQSKTIFVYTTHADFSQYDSFIFDSSIKTDFILPEMSDFYHEEFAGELAHIISPSEYDHFYFKIEPELGNFTMDVDKVINTGILAADEEKSPHIIGA